MPRRRAYLRSRPSPGRNLGKPNSYAFARPDLVAFRDAPKLVEQTLFVMFLERRMRTFQGTFHASPDYAPWDGRSQM